MGLPQYAIVCASRPIGVLDRGLPACALCVGSDSCHKAMLNYIVAER
jgi:hypothetical protein